MHTRDQTVSRDELKRLHRLVLARLLTEGMRLKRHAEERADERGFPHETLSDIIEHGDPDWSAIRLVDGRPALRIWADIRLTDERGRLSLREAAVVVAMNPRQGIDVITIMWRDERAPAYQQAAHREMLAA